MREALQVPLVGGGEFKPPIVPLDYSKMVVGEKGKAPAPDPFIQRYAGKIYYDPWIGLDYRMNPWLRNNRAIERVIWAFASSAITVPTILPTFLDPSYIYALPTDAPLYAALPRKASLGAHEDYVRITSLTAPSIGYWISQTQAPEYESEGSARVSQLKAIAQTWGGVTGFMKAAGNGYKDMLEEAHRGRLLALLTEGLEDGMINGDGTGTNAKGIITWQTGTNEIAGGSANVTIAKIQEAIRAAFVAGGDLESYGFAVTDPVTWDYVKNLLMEYVSYVNIMNYDLPWGLKTFSIQGVPFLRSRKMPTGSNVKAIVFVDRRHTYVAALQDVVTELYGKTKDASEFAIKFYGNCINRAPEFGSIITAIA